MKKATVCAGNVCVQVRGNAAQAINIIGVLIAFSALCYAVKKFTEA
jgi:hypothetical protein